MTPKKTHPYRPQSNSKNKRFYKVNSRTYTHCCISEQQRRDTHTSWSHFHDRPAHKFGQRLNNCPWIVLMNCVKDAGRSRRCQLSGA